MKHDTSHLEKQLKKLDECITELHQVKLAEQLQLMIKRPGWTTLPEAFLVNSAVESLIHQIEGQVRACRKLLEGAKMIEESGAKAA
ncbi:MAG TPA: hypothetical protein VKZ53_05730 [Candidatus Angelobacter sp.]|nr:hypothetical protein [Candidatus Angelobacter sp.]